MALVYLWLDVNWNHTLFSNTSPCLWMEATSIHHYFNITAACSFFLFCLSSGANTDEIICSFTTKTLVLQWKLIYCFSDLLYFYLCLCYGLLNVCKYLRRLEEGIRFLGDGVTGSYESLELWAVNWSLVPCESRTHSQSPSYPLQPHLYYFQVFLVFSSLLINLWKLVVASQNLLKFELDGSMENSSCCIARFQVCICQIRKPRTAGKIAGEAICLRLAWAGLWTGKETRSW